MTNLRLIVVWLYAICLICGLIVTGLAFYAVLDHWIAWQRGIWGTHDRSIIEFTSIGTLALLDTLAFAFILARRGSNLLAPIPYLIVSFFQTTFASGEVISLHKSNAFAQDVFGKGGYWAIDGWTPIWVEAQHFGIIIAITGAGLAWNWFMSGWRDLDSGLIYQWTQRFHPKKPIRTPT